MVAPRALITISITSVVTVTVGYSTALSFVDGAATDPATALGKSAAELDEETPGLLPTAVLPGTSVDVWVIGAGAGAW